MSDIPATWEWSTIGNVTQYIQRGKSPKYAEQSVLPVINQKCIRWNELQLQHLKYIHPDQIDAWDEPRYIKPGDILWNSTGTGTVGRAYLVTSEDTVLPKVVDSHVTIVRAAPDLEPRYLFNWIKSPAVQNEIEEMCDGTTNQIELSRTAIAATAIPIAPRAEQTRIADQLDTLLARVNACNDHLDAIPGILKRFRQAVLNTTQTDEFSIEDTSRESADAWQSTTVGEVLEGKPRNGYSPKAVPYETPVKSLTLSATTTGRFLPQHTKFIDEHIPENSHLWLECGDILIQRANTLDYVGVSAIFEGPSKAFIYPDLMMKCKPKAHVRGKFLLYALSTESTRQYFRDNATGTAGNMPKINQQTVMAAPILIPDLKTQDKIIRQADLLIGAADRIEARYTAMRAHAQRLAPQVLTKAFRGELVEQDPQDEPASVLLARLRSQRSTSSTQKAPPRPRQPRTTR